MEKDPTNRNQWPGYVAVLTYGLTSPTVPAMENLEAVFAYLLDQQPDDAPPVMFSTAIRLALASDVNLTGELALRYPDPVVREYLRALEVRVSKHLGE